MTESRAGEIRRAAVLMRERAQAASPGPWHQMCMGSEGCSVINDGRLRERKHVSFSGRKEWKADHADAEYIAGMHPSVALALADWLDDEAQDAGFDTEILAEVAPYLEDDGHGHRRALAVARAYLGQAAQAAGTEG